MKKMNFKKGFTLIELLVVVAIIGILATVVLSSVNSARTKAGDAAVKSNLGTVRSQSEVFYSNNGNSYLPAGGAIHTIQACPTPYNAGGSNMLVRDRNMFDAIVQATAKGSGVNSCYNSSGLWAVAVGLKSNANLSWCVDSGGASKQVASAPGSAIDVATFDCN